MNYDDEIIMMMTMIKITVQILDQSERGGAWSSASGVRWCSQGLSDLRTSATAATLGVFASWCSGTLLASGLSQGNEMNCLDLPGALTSEGRCPLSAER